MYISQENKKKVLYSTLFTVLSAASVITGKTLANTLILTAYSTSILHYFYSSLALTFILFSFISSKYQSKHPRKFTLLFKVIYLFLLIFIFKALAWDNSAIPFIVSILILTFGLVNTTFPWNYIADIFDFQEFKQYTKIFQLSFTIGGIIIGVLISSIALFSVNLTPTLLLGIIFITELFSLFCIIPLSKYLPLLVAVRNQAIENISPLKKNSLFKYFTLLFITATLITTLVDYNLKLVIASTIETQKIANTINIINIFCTAGTLILQVFFIDYFFKIFGSKKIIIIYPIILCAMSMLTYIYTNFFSAALLFILNDLFFSSTFVISKDLYLNILPLALKRLARLKLNGIVKPLTVLSASFIIWVMNYIDYKSRVSLLLIIIFSVYSLYLARVLIKKYLKQLTKSVYLRRFEPELINLGQVDQQDFDYLIKQALDYPDPDAQLYGLELLVTTKSPLPQSLSQILTGKNSTLVKEAAKLLANKREQRQFVREATQAFFNTSDEETRWYLTLYLVEDGAEDCIDWVDDLRKKKTVPSFAIICIIYLKQGDLQQHIIALKLLFKMFYSYDIEARKWFLHILGEFTWLHKEKYLIPFINQEIASLQILAIQNIGTMTMLGSSLLESLLNHIGTYQIAHVLNTRLVEMGEGVTSFIEKKYKEAPSYQFKLPCINIISQIKGEKAEESLIKLLLSTDDGFIKTMIAKHLAWRSVTIEISNNLKKVLLELMKKEVRLYKQLEAQTLQYSNPLIQLEFNCQIQLTKKSMLYFLAAFIGSVDVLNSVSSLDSFKLDKNQQALAIELIDAASDNKEISSLLSELFINKEIKDDSKMVPVASPWMNQYIYNIESSNMQPIYTYTRLRKVELFKNLPSETLQVLVTCCSTRNINANEIIFKEGDPGNGLYIIDSGEVIISKQGKEINRLTDFAYFGELALLSDMPRFATATAHTEGVLFYINKMDFDRITDEVPEIMKSITKQIINYLVERSG